MKKITILLAYVLLTTAISAQSFSDNFDLLNAGDYIGPTAIEWTTWGGVEGGEEDVQVSAAQSLSGANSIYFLGQTADGPQDVLLNFGQEFTDGVMTYESAFFIKNGKTCFFNFQATSIPGTTWALNCNMANGTLTIDNGGTDHLAVGSYVDETWFTLTIKANLSTGRWQGFIDGGCFGVWINSVNQLASVDFFPLETSEFYVDNVSFNHVAYTPSALNAAVTGFNIGGSIAGTSTYPEVTVANAGTDPITSFDVKIDMSGSYVESVSGVNLTAGQSMTVQYTTPFQLMPGTWNATAKVMNVNGGTTDGDPSDDAACLVSKHVTPTGVADLNNKPSFRMYPNPASTVAFIEADFDNKSEVSIKLIDIAGRIVASKNYGIITAGSRLPLNTMLKAGVYLVEVTINNVTITQRLIVQ